eukprot:2260695-Rhodomonas_salina.1
MKRSVFEMARRGSSTQQAAGVPLGAPYPGYLAGLNPQAGSKQLKVKSVVAEMSIQLVQPLRYYDGGILRQ